MPNNMLGKAKSLSHNIKQKIPKGGSGTLRYARHPTGEYLVALDVGTEFVKALVGRVVGDEIEIIGVGRTHQELTDMQAGAISDIAAVLANCDRALAEEEQPANVSARSAIIGIAG